METRTITCYSLEELEAPYKYRAKELVEKSPDYQEIVQERLEGLVAEILEQEGFVPEHTYVDGKLKTVYSLNDANLTENAIFYPVLQQVQEKGIGFIVEFSIALEQQTDHYGGPIRYQTIKDNVVLIAVDAHGEEDQDMVHRLAATLWDLELSLDKAIDNELTHLYSLKVLSDWAEKNGWLFTETGHKCPC